ncbi:type I methionyl aminopeptidase [Mumia sp. ZJ1417]|uniref:type I methionyl aminopeptidase n=1 Tax=Mumia sp. ZJ1417 TaxID=2708082 RepID=UPI00141F4308|nr:type I methionyl aminopeptidase [Mumia sp. ZJ1417]QMW67061.1 type I methionyl aminopeptidase [Mumia sp. ZJ1417]
MIEIKTPAQIAQMREAGRIVARALAAMKAGAAVGVAPKELDAVAAGVLADAGATSPFLDYHPGWAPVPFPATLCFSANDAVVHGIPGSTPLADGDLVSLDFGAILDGWAGDAAISFVVGEADPADLDLIAATESALHAGIAQAVPGNKLGDVAHAIGTVARGAGYGLLADHGGHGIGRTMHEDPHVPNEGRAGRGLTLRPGLVLAIEPMLIAGGIDDYVTDPDGWTLRTVDGSRAAHVEHTVAITEDGPQILTLE